MRRRGGRGLLGLADGGFHRPLGDGQQGRGGGGELVFQAVDSGHRQANMLVYHGAKGRKRCGAGGGVEG